MEANPEAYRPARLSPAQLERLQALERELGVVLVAFDRDEPPSNPGTAGDARPDPPPRRP